MINKVEFIALQDTAQLSEYLHETEKANLQFDGSRFMVTQIDQYFAGEKMRYTHLLIDQFQAQDQALKCDQELSAPRKSYLRSRYSFLVHPNLKIPKQVKSMHWLSGIFNLFLGAGKEKPLPDLDAVDNPNIAPTFESVKELKTHDQHSPFFMMNLNKFYPQGQYTAGETISGEAAYEKYSKSVFPYLVAVKGYPAIYGKVIQVLESDDQSSLPDDWNEFALVSYPSRAHFLRLLTNAPQKAIKHRDASLERALLMLCSTESEF